MRYLTTLNLLLLSAFSANAQLSFNEIALNVGSTSSEIKNMTDINGTVYFQSSRPAEGRELWATDGTLTGTRLVKDINTGSANADPRSFTAFNGKVYFTAFGNGAVGCELWETDGTTSGTKQITQSTLSSASIIGDIKVANGKMYFAANTAAEGIELWISDGTTSGTQLLKDLYPGVGGGYPFGLTEFNGKLYFTAYNGPSQELWSSDGTTAGTTVVSSIGSGNNTGMSGLSILNNALYFTAINSTGNTLYKSDGTTAGTVPVATLNTNTTLSRIQLEHTVVNNKLYFTSDKGNNNMQLWVTDGTAAGTIMLIEDNIGTSSNFVSNITAYNGKAYFVYHNTWDNLYCSDGSVSGTRPAEGYAKYLTATPFDAVTDLTIYNGRLFFNATSNYYGTSQLYGYTADNDIVSIRPLNNTVLKTVTLLTGKMCVSNNKLLINAGYNSNEGYELWSIEGTPTAISNTAIKTAQAFTLYPNPAKNVLHITTTNQYKNASITITNAMGQAVLTENISNNTISLQGIAPGIYTATIDADGQRETQQLSIQ